MKKKNAGAALRALKPVKEFVCAQCGKSFKSSEKAIFCGVTCNKGVSIETKS